MVVAKGWGKEEMGWFRLKGTNFQLSEKQSLTFQADHLSYQMLS